MALGKLMEVFQSNCTGIGYWTHFLCGGAAGCLSVASKPRSWMATFHKMFVFLLVSYQGLDYAYGAENIMSHEFGLFRDLGEYFIGYTLVQLGARLHANRVETRSQIGTVGTPGPENGIPNSALATIITGAVAFDTSRVILEVILPVFFLKALQLDRSVISFLVSCRFFGSFLGMFLTGPLTAALSAPTMTSAGLGLLGSIIGGLSFYRKDVSAMYLYVAMFAMGALASMVSVSLNTTVQIHGSADPATANTVYRSFGLAAKLFVPSLASSILVFYDRTVLSQEKLGAMIFLFRCLSMLAICGAVLVALTSTSLPTNRKKEKKYLDVKAIVSIFTTIFAYRPLYFFCIVLSCIASIEPVVKEGYLVEKLTNELTMSTPLYSTVHTLAALTSLGLVVYMSKQLKQADLRSALFVLLCIHSFGMIGMSSATSSLVCAASYILVRAATELAKIVTGMYTTRCAEGHFKTHSGEVPVDVVLASGLAFQKMLGSLLKAAFTFLVGSAGASSNLGSVFWALTSFAVISTYFMSKLPPTGK